ncbi:MAG: sulfatase-like hydrolase/transferase [Anaerolineales bacterium]|nr:sulfatase-like hydrolase/transferase [Anaerolineales bacterium]
MSKKSFTVQTALILIITTVSITACSSLPSDQDSRPNFLIIVTDDQRYDTMQYMPRTEELIFDAGVAFTHAYVTTPLCCPSRASILTGMYARHHLVKDNDGELNFPTVIDDLSDNGYYTGLVGKYLNTWSGEPRPEYSFWVSFAHGESRYNNPRLNVNGEWIRHQDEYITYALRDYAIEFIQTASHKNQPFALIFAPNAPHQPATPAAEDKYQDLILPERLLSFNEEDLTDKPAWMRDEPLLTDEAIAELDKFRRDQILSLASLDRSIDELIGELQQFGLLDRTVVIFLSDNGKQWGEHRMTSKNSYYEESSHVPFALRYPPLAPTPYVEDRVVANIDIAPTLYELAGLPIPERVDGLSFVGLFDQNAEWREGILIEGWPGRGVYSAFHTERYVYAETEGDLSELYDLENDPYQMTNLVNDPNYSAIIEDLKAKLIAAK